MQVFDHKQFSDIGIIRMFFAGQGVMINGWTPGIPDLMAEDWELYTPAGAAVIGAHSRIATTMSLIDGPALSQALMQACVLLGIPTCIEPSANL
jgi:hypothetical protein